MSVHPESPRAYCDRLNLKIDISSPGNPAIVGKTGKRHFYMHGNAENPGQCCNILRRLLRMKGLEQ